MALGKRVVVVSARRPRAGSTVDRVLPPPTTTAPRDSAAVKTTTDRAAVAIAIGVVLAGFVLRVSAARRLSPHVDEPASILAARMVAERGVPLFPSDVLYLQGTPLSYLLAPLAWFGALDLDHLFLARIPSLVAGSIAIWLTYQIGSLLTTARWPALLAAALLAVDPQSVQWSGHVRMYGLLQALTLAVILCFLLELGDNETGRGRRRRLAAMVALFWVACFTHILAALLWPGLALAAIVIAGRSLLDRRRDLARALVACAVAPLVVVALNGLVAALGDAIGGGSGGAGFVGDQLIDVSRIADPYLTAWSGLFARGALPGLIPTLLTLLIGIAIGQVLLAAHGMMTERERQRLTAVLLAYGLPILLVAALTSEPQPRYLVQIHPLGFVLAATALGLIARASLNSTVGRQLLAGGGIAVLAAMLVYHSVDGVWNRLANPVVDPDHIAALRFVAEQRRGDQIVAVAFPSTAYLALDGRDGVRFLAGPEGHNRVKRYTRSDGRGDRIDYWIGAPAVTSTAELCGLIRDHPDSWLVVDRLRLQMPWAYVGPFADVLTGATREVHTATGGALVLRPLPPPAWSSRANGICETSTEPAAT